MKTIKQESIEVLQQMLDRMNSRINLEHEIDTWNHCCDEDEKIIIEEKMID